MAEIWLHRLCTALSVWNARTSSTGGNGTTTTTTTTTESYNKKQPQLIERPKDTVPGNTFRSFKFNTSAILESGFSAWLVSRTYKGGRYWELWCGWICSYACTFSFSSVSSLCLSFLLERKGCCTWWWSVGEVVNPLDDGFRWQWLRPATIKGLLYPM